MPNKKQIFCFTYAGGNASFFDSIASDLSEYEVIPFEYSGHGTRHREPLYSSFYELADDLYSLFRQKYKDGEYALFGYSMGTISLIEVLKRIIDEKYIRLPSHIFLAAHEPLTKAEYAGYTNDEMDAWVKDRTIRFGTVPEKLLNNKSFWRMYLPLYRADYNIIGKYRFEELCLKSEIPVTIFYSETDTPLRDMKLWKNIFVGDCEYYRFDGTHFFIQQYHKEMADIIRNRMAGEKIDDV